MSYKYIINILAFFIVFGLSANEDKTTCMKTSDCALSEDVCFFPIGINKKFLKTYEKKVAKSRPMATCKEFYGPTKKNFIVSCKNKKCEITENPDLKIP